MECNFDYLDSFTLILKLRAFLEEKSKDGDKSVDKLLDKLIENVYPISDNIYKCLPKDYKEDFRRNYM
jgi:hypothetical protein